ncbi:glycoside hydrolase [Coccomyxa subellipsoidea C-169]|uniref:mannan endo-1,4-beta-mannosidase n=1 Tax=Coccomyxa subellipsoidea (strain C-169) TaxID=574566 RepID=I0Z0G2_COCSC|nr:glycoside hydrolase [Coccomyxa subellipsoidea C-169]EIE24131.1 glycoside hydrolase [Coccomyxa subellipsoidea C-169]|eukprot:XP_005648675.1 glycoside hydrolase [Coccomyxa subellipsoidea C-169]
MRGWAVALALALAVLTAGSAAAAPPGLQGFIRVSNGTFVDDGWVSLNSVAADAAYSLPDGSAALADNVQNDVVSLFQEAQTSGFNAVRLFAHGGDVNFQLQVSPGKYNESVFRGIDYILALAGKYQVKYLAWAHIALEYQDTFWTSKEVRDMIKDHFSVVVNRRNMFTGKLYKEDDTIFAWDIYNVLAAGRYWSAKIGQDFQAQHAFPSIDYTTIHLWPDNWETQDPDFPRTWIEAHDRASAAMGKPLVLEEFGKGQGKNATYQAVYDTLQDSLARNGSFKGALFWR